MLHLLTCIIVRTCARRIAVAAGEAIVYKFAASAFTASTPPVVSDATWTATFSSYVACKAAYFMPDGQVAALVTSETETSLVMLNGGTNAVVWGPTDYHTVHGEGTDMKVCTSLCE